MKRVIFNADDFGFSEKVNNGIVCTFEKGVVRDSSLIMTMPATEHAIKQIKMKKLDAGIHLTLNEGEPLSKEKNNSIIYNGKFLGMTDFIMKIFLKKVKKEDVREEFEEQIEKFCNEDLKPTHLDTHKYIHIFPIIFEVIEELAHEYKIKAVRISDEEFSRKLYKLPIEPILSAFSTQVFKSIFVSKLSSVTKKRLAKYRLVTTDYFYGISRINSKHVLESFENIVNNLKEGTAEVMCHPGYYDPKLKRITPYVKQREEELEALTSNKIKNLIKDRKIKLINFKDL